MRWGGEIGVESEVGKGSTFWVRLPVATSEAPDHTLQPLSQNQPIEPLNVLFVEDNEINRIVAREMLQSEGHTVVEAHDGQQGVELSEAQAFDLILMDISMPVMDGRTATRTIRAGDGLSKTVPIVALTANAMVEELEEFLKDGMNAILTKPLSRRALREMLEHTGRSQDRKQILWINEEHSDETRVALGEDSFVKLRSRFAAEVDDFHDWLTSDAAQDYLEIASRAHKVAGSAAVFGADQLRGALKVVEASAKQGDVGGIDEATARLELIWKNTKTQLLD